MGDLPLLGEAELSQVLAAGRGEIADRRESMLHELFAAQAALSPEAVALISGEERVTYRELRRQASRLAQRLRAAGVGPEVPVAILLPRAPRLVAALLGTLAAGGAYVPLDPAYPRERLAAILDDSAAPVVVTDAALADLLPFDSARIVLADHDEPVREVRDLPRPDPSRLAYVIYTSGSTGRPKGVAITHQSAVELMHWARQTFSAGELAGALAATSVCFDLSVFELFAPLSWGGTVILADNALALPELPARGEVTLINTVPSAMAELLRLGAVPASVRTVNLAGEALRRSLVDRVRTLGTVGRVLNLYGPSEDTTYSTELEVGEGPGEPTIGRPLPNSRALVLDRGLRPVPVGVPGELCLGGAGLARGYFGRPDLTAERFVPDPFAAIPGARLYRTGDLARWSTGRPGSPGDIEFLGRADHQVKVRGFRIELGEVEAVLAGHPAVESVAVVAREIVPGDLRLVAYVARRPAVPLAFPDELREHLRSRLPEYMLPSLWMELPALPLTPNGKVDRRALPAPVVQAGEADSVAPRTAEEELLAGIFAQVLALDRVGICDDFFALGGHSLLGTQLISQVRQVFGREVPLRALFESPTVAGLALAVARAGRAVAPPLVPVPRPAPGAAGLPLSFAQERLWFLEQLEPGTAFYSMPAAVLLEGPLAVPVLAAVLREIVERHEALRTIFGDRDGRPFQAIAPHPEVKLPLVDLAVLPPAERERTLGELATGDARRPFDLARGPLVRFALVRLKPERHALLFNLHHIVSDGWSSQVLLREVVALYEAFAAGRPSPLPPLPIQYADYAVWQRSWLQGEVQAAELAYWRRQLAGIAGLDLPLDRPRPPVETFRGAHLRLDLDGELTAALHALSRGQGATLFMTLLAGFQALLSRLTRQVDVPVGSPIANRNRAEVEGLIGFFANTLVLRTDLAGDPGFQPLLRRVREVALEAYAHQELPFEKLVGEIQPERDMSRNPLFQVMCVLQNQPQAAAGIEGLVVRPLAVDTATAKFDLTVFWHESEGRLLGLVEFNTDLFDPATARRLSRHYEALLRGAVAAPDRPFTALPLLSPAERHQVLVEWNGTDVVAGATSCVHRWVEEQVRRSPATVAAVFEGHGLTYEELNRRANRMAHGLRRRGVGPESLVGICLERSLGMLVSMLAVLKAGGGMVALDPAYPVDRLAFIIQDARLRALITQESLLRHFPGQEAIAILLEGDTEPFPGESGEDPASGVELDNPIYAIYTSGSTGMPKGILVTHRAFANLLDWQLRRSSLSGVARTVQFATFGFCVSFQEVFSSWCSGGTLVLASEMVRRDVVGLNAFLEAQEIERLHLPFAALKHLAEAAAEQDRLPSRLREVITAGEQLQVNPTVRLLFERLPGCSLHNQYGASETHVVSALTLAGVPGSWPAIPSIGRPIVNVRIHLLDAHLEPVPVGVPGELYAAGACVPRGYLNDPVLTAQKMVPDPYAAEPGARLYRTGDSARYLADGQIEYHGRIDTQVKIRGFRVELGEIDTVLASHPAVRDAAVVAPAAREGRRLVAYVVLEEQGEETLGELRAFLKQKLPEYMVPSAFVVMESLPLNANGKLDQAALPAPDPAQQGARERVLPRNAAEAALAQIWAEVLGLEQVGVRDSFFELGGHSLLATQVVSRARAAFGVELPIRRLFEAPTIEELAAELGEPLAAATMAPAAVQPAPRLAAPPLVPLPRPLPVDVELPLSFAQERLWFLDRLEPGSALYNMPGAVRLRGRLATAALEAAIGEIVRRHEVLRTGFAEGRNRRPVQVIAPWRPRPLPAIDLSALPAATRDTVARRLAQEEATRAFALAASEASPPWMLRVTLLRLGALEHCPARHLPPHRLGRLVDRGVPGRAGGALWHVRRDGQGCPLATP